MAETSSTTEVWIQRVEAWRASGERAEAFSRGEGYAASTLRWWASRLKREMAPPPPPPAPVPSPEVRLARVIRAAPTTTAVAVGPGRPAITLDVVHAGVRIGVEPGADRTTLAMVLDVLGVGR